METTAMVAHRMRPEGALGEPLVVAARGRSLPGLSTFGRATQAF